MTAFDYEKVKDLPLTEFGEVSKETLWATLTYFLEAVVPEAEKIGIKLANTTNTPTPNTVLAVAIEAKPQLNAK